MISLKPIALHSHSVFVFSQATLNGFIEARDLARHQLVENLRQFSVIASSLPLDLRAASLRGVIQSLEKNYAFFLNSNMMMESHPLVDILQVFREWRVG